MTKQDALKHYNHDVRAIAEALGISESAVYQWSDTVPLMSALRLQVLSGGVLRVDLRRYAPDGRARRGPVIAD